MLIACPGCKGLIRVERAQEAERWVCMQRAVRLRRSAPPIPVGAKVRWRGAIAEVVHASETRSRLRLPSPGTRLVDFAEHTKTLKDGTKKVVAAKTVEMTIRGAEYDLAPGVELEVVA